MQTPVCFVLFVRFVYLDVYFCRRLPVARSSHYSDDSTDSEEELDSPKRITQQPAQGENMDVDSSEGINHVTRSCLKPQNPCSNHEIHMLFEDGFYFKKPKLGPDLLA